MATFTEGDIVGRLGAGGGYDGMGGIGGGLLLGLLLGRGGLFGNQNDALTQADLNAQSLGDIKASIPFNEAQVQLALAASTASISQNVNRGNSDIIANQNAFALNQANLAALLTRDIAAVDTNVDRQSMNIQTAIHADGEATRALITSNRIADLEQQLTVAQLRESEQRSINREIVNTNTITIGMNQQQSQQQQQMQYLQWQLSNLLGGVGQLARATNSSVVVGSSGVGTQQTANPTNVSA